MRLSRATGYALHALAFLARQKDDGNVSTKTIAGAIGIPDVFLLKALKPLVARQILRSITGPRGGYRLARPVDEITVLEVIEAVEGPMVSVSSYRSPNSNSTVDKALDRLTEDATKQLRDVFNGATLSQLVGARAGRDKST